MNSSTVSPVWRMMARSVPRSSSLIGNRCLRGWGLAYKYDVTAALSVNFEPNLGESLYTISARNDGQLTHAATSTNSTRSSGIGSPRSRKTSSCNEIASRTFSSASSRVLPWLIQPGRLGTSATINPSSPGYKRTRRVMGEILTYNSVFGERHRRITKPRRSALEVTNCDFRF